MSASKQSVLSPPITLCLPAAPRDATRIAADLKLGRDPFLLARRLAKGGADFAEVDLGTDYLTSLYALYKRGDRQLEVLLHSGSILSLWMRLHALFELPQETARELVRWSIIRQAPKMNKSVWSAFLLPLQEVDERSPGGDPPAYSSGAGSRLLP